MACICENSISDEFMDDVQEGLVVGKSTEQRFAVTGEPYITICGDRIKDEMQDVPVMYAYPSEAYTAFVKAVREYKGFATNATIYWRSQPKLMLEHLDGGRVMFYVTARLLISNSDSRI
jgi:hypothetical protein